MEMEMGGDVRAYIGKYGVVSEKATTGLLEKKRQFFENKRAECKRQKTQICFKSIQNTNVLWSKTQNRMNRRHDARKGLKRS